jgi:hypothetical protein
MSLQPIELEAVAADPARFRPALGLEPYPPRPPAQPAREAVAEDGPGPARDRQDAPEPQDTAGPAEVPSGDGPAPYGWPLDEPVAAPAAAPPPAAHAVVAAGQATAEVTRAAQPAAEPGPGTTSGEGQ